MHTPKRWNMPQVDAEAARGLADRLNTSPLLAQILLNHGLMDVESCQSFLRPSLKSLHEPASLPNLQIAAERIAKAIRDGQSIVIYGDYDVDGITATSILWHAIRTLGGKPSYYIPHRIEEGYGLNAEAIAQICDQGAGLIVTVDCGVTATGPAGVAAERGVDLIITDHHDLHEHVDDQGNRVADLPVCHSIVHPRLSGSKYQNPYLCGAGVAFKLAWGIGQAMNGAAKVDDAFRAFLLEATALAALGTIADVVPLVGENRILAHYGLGGLKQSNLIGVQALIESANLTDQKLDSYHVGFLLAPRLNACGRMGHARLAVRMLTDADQAKSLEIAQYLEKQNRLRQQIERKILEEALGQIQSQGRDPNERRSIVLGSADWHPGVIGIVASRLVERFNRPTIMVAMTNGHGQGSGRSIAGFHLLRALESCHDCLETYGGHEMAAGLKVQSSRFEEFQEAFEEHARASLDPQLLVPELAIECQMELSQVNVGLVNDLKRLEPFGNGNRRPILCCRGVEMARPARRVGKTGDHLQLLVKQGDAMMKGIAFGAGDLMDQLTAGRRVDLAVEPTINEYNGRSSVELNVKDIQLI
ncbi:MAG: single-stranded-DNA-specific exonuclease RecJ [Phycisphaerales bacterium]|jgi:single-stranded-DNA-specific exonuclease|nr:single-stranded-DNA-specific exonuclease RecJ [Phycisphaerales bacterium]